LRSLAAPIPAQSAAVLALLAMYLGHAAVFGWYIADDAGISLAYARNLAHGFGPVLYAGAPAVEGYSNPLWVGILTVAAGLHLDGGDGIVLLKIAGLLFGLAALVLTMVLARVVYPEDADLHWLAPALLAAWTPFVFWSGAGLENPLYACVLVGSATLQLRELREPSLKPWSALALLAVATTRPEGCAFFIAFLVHRLVVAPPLTAIALRRLAAWCGTFVTGFAVFLLARHAVFGAWVPNTYYAKAGGRHLSALAHYLSDPDDGGWQYVRQFVGNAWPILIAAAISFADLRHWRSVMLFAAIAGGTVLYVVFVGGDFWPQARFFTATLPFLAVAAQHGIVIATRAVPRARQIAAAVLLVVVASFSLRPSLDLRAQDQNDTLISLQGRLKQGRKVRALADAAGIADPLYLDPDIGGPALAGLRILDLGGLTDIHIARFQYDPYFFATYVFVEQRPHYIRTQATWTKSSRITAYPEFAEQYVAIEEHSDALGRHGLFVRRDLASGAAPRTPNPSFAQAVRDAWAVRAREKERGRPR
jgi:hypothetical protein